MRILAVTAILPAGATLFFFILWRWFGYWRKHQILTYAMILGTLLTIGTLVYVFRRSVFAVGADLPVWVQAVGWVVVAGATVFAFVADRQIGIHVRAFAPFFDSNGRIELKTTGAYGVVRHPIYTAGIWYQLGVFFVTGYLAVAVACSVFSVGALWFTRQEERRLVELLEDPSEYERYRDRVPALFPRIKRWPAGRS